jgi:sugar lactone lactonase YvrE
MEWFRRRGGRVDPDRIPGVKPAASKLYVAEDGYLWVGRILPTAARAGSVFDVFDPEGRLMGQVTLPFIPSLPPVIRGTLMVAVVERQVPYVVRARIVRPGRAVP